MTDYIDGTDTNTVVEGALNPVSNGAEDNSDTSTNIIYERAEYNTDVQSVIGSAVVDVLKMLSEFLKSKLYDL